MIRLLFSALAFALFAAPALAQEDELPPLPTRADVLAEIEAAMRLDFTDPESPTDPHTFVYDYEAVIDIFEAALSQIELSSVLDYFLTTTASTLRNPHLLFPDAGEADVLAFRLQAGIVAVQLGDQAMHDRISDEMYDLLWPRIIEYFSNADNLSSWHAELLAFKAAELFHLLGDQSRALQSLEAGFEFGGISTDGECPSPQLAGDYFWIGERMLGRQQLLRATSCLTAEGPFDWDVLMGIVIQVAVHEPEGAFQLMREAEALAETRGILAEDYQALARRLVENDHLEVAGTAFDRAYLFMANDPHEYQLRDWGMMALLAAQTDRCDSYLEIEPFLRAVMAREIVQARLDSLRLGPSEDRIIIGGPRPEHTVAGRLLTAEILCGHAYEAVRQYEHVLTEYGSVHQTHGMFGDDQATLYLSIYQELTPVRRDALLDALNRLNALPEPRFDESAADTAPYFDQWSLLIMRVLAAHEPFSPIDRELAIHQVYRLAHAELRHDWHRSIAALAWLAVALPE